MVTQLGYIVEEGSDHIILYSQLRHLVVGVLATFVCNDVLKNVSDCSLLLLVVHSLC